MEFKAKIYQFEFHAENQFKVHKFFLDLEFSVTQFTKWRHQKIRKKRTYDKYIVDYIAHNSSFCL